MLYLCRSKPPEGTWRPSTRRQRRIKVVYEHRRTRSKSNNARTVRCANVSAAPARSPAAAAAKRARVACGPAGQRAGQALYKEDGRQQQTKRERAARPPRRRLHTDPPGPRGLATRPASLGHRACRRPSESVHQLKIGPFHPGDGRTRNMDRPTACPEKKIRPFSAAPSQPPFTRARGSAGSAAHPPVQTDTVHCHSAP